MNVRIFAEQSWVAVAQKSKKGLSTLTIATLILSMSGPAIFAFPVSAFADTPVALFSDSFDQSSSSLTNGWTTISGFDTPSRIGTNAVSSPNALNFKGGIGSDDAAERDIATKGYSTLHLAYKVRSSSIDTGDSFTAQYYLDGVLADSDTWTVVGVNQPLTVSLSKDLSNSDRHTKLTIRFTIVSDSPSDSVGVDDLSLTGEGSPFYWTGFEVSSLSGDGWTIEDSPDINTDQDEIWTDATDNGSADGKSAHFNGGTDPDDAIQRTISTVGLENIKVRYMRDADSFGGGDNFKPRYSTDGGATWTTLETISSDISQGSVMFPLPAAADNNANLMLRFEIHADSSSGDHAYVDDVVVWGDALPLGSISGYKYDQDENGLSDWTINLWNGSGWTTTTTDESGHYSFDDLADGSYTVCEESQPGWMQLSPSEEEGSGLCADSAGYDVTIEAAADVTAKNFSNEELGSITIVKATTPAEVDQDFAFTSGELGSFMLNTAGEYSQTFSDLVPGQFGVTETTVDGYVLTGVSCDDSNSSAVGAVATINVEAGEHVTCTYTNERLPNLTIVKYGSAGDSTFDINVVGDGEYDHTFTANVAGDGQDTTANLADEENPFLNLQPGVYNLSEQLPEGWTGSHTVSCYLNGDEDSWTGEGSNTSAELGYGDNVTCIFNNTPYSTIVGDKFEDLDGNGEGTSGPGLNEWHMTLYKWNADQETPGYVENSDTYTNEGGTYSFGNILPGKYLICEENREGWNQSTNMGNSDACGGLGEAANGYTLEIADIPATEGNLPGQEYNGFSFGNWQYGTVVGLKWNDANANGVLDEGEAGLGDWTINLSGNESDSTLTTTGGAYIFGEVAPGSYTVSEVMQEGWAQTYPGDNSHEIVVQSGDNIIRNFGNVEDSTISGNKWMDNNGNGVRDEGDNILTSPNFTFQLVKEIGEGTEPVGSPITSSSGYYEFAGLLPGVYHVLEVSLPTNWQQTYPANEAGYTVTVGINEDSTGNDFGNVQIAKITGMKFNDLNRNGNKGWHEPGLQGWTIVATPMTTEEQCVGDEEPVCSEVTVVDQSRTAKTIVTDQNGDYSFGFLPTEAGTWRISEQNQSGWSQTMPSEPIYYDVAVTAGGIYNCKDFGNWQWPIIEIFKWNDANNDGIRDQGEAPVADYPVAIGRTVAKVQGEGEDVGHDIIDTEMVQLSLTGSDGFAHIALDPAWFDGFNGLDNAIQQGLMAFEGTRDHWQKTFPNFPQNDQINPTWRDGLTPQPMQLDSFFDIFTEIEGAMPSGTVLDQGKQHDTYSPIIPLDFGNHFTAPVTETPPTTTSGSGSNGSPSLIGQVNGSPATSPGEVLGASTFIPVPGEQCNEFITAFMGPNRNNNAEQVKRLQQILLSEGFNAVVNGVYDDATFEAVKAFQKKYAADILAPWGISEPTGLVYLTTRKKLNEIYCTAVGQTFPLTDEEQAIINGFKKGGNGGGGSGGSAGGDNAPDTTQSDNIGSQGSENGNSAGSDSQVGAAAGATGGDEGDSSDNGFWGKLKSFLGF